MKNHALNLLTTHTDRKVRPPMGRSFPPRTKKVSTGNSMARKRLQAGKVPAKRKERVPVRQEHPEEIEESEGKSIQRTFLSFGDFACDLSRSNHQTMSTPAVPARAMQWPGVAKPMMQKTNVKTKRRTVTLSAFLLRHACTPTHLRDPEKKNGFPAQMPKRTRVCGHSHRLISG